MIRKRFVFLIVVAVPGLPGMAHTGTITMLQVATQTTSAALSCMRWIPIGASFWLPNFPGNAWVCFLRKLRLPGCGGYCSLVTILG